MIIKLRQKELEDKFKGKKVVVVTGAGVSTLSGIPDYSSMDGIIAENGIYYNARDILSTWFTQRFRNDFFEWYNEHFCSQNFERNKVHCWIKYLETITCNLTVITQNIDGLHDDINNLIEFHGNAYKFDDSGLPDIVYYGKSIKEENIKNTVNALKNSDYILILGTELQVEPLSNLVLKHTNENTYWINKVIPEVYYNNDTINLIISDFECFLN